MFPTRRHAMRALSVSGLAILIAAVAACGGGPEMTAGPDQVLIHVQHRAIETVTVNLEDMTGAAVALGNVRADPASPVGEMRQFRLYAPDFQGTYRLIAVSAEHEQREDYIISEPFDIEGGMVITWILPDNDLNVEG